jgi:hypothetical protein
MPLMIQAYSNHQCRFFKSQVCFKVAVSVSYYSRGHGTRVTALLNVVCTVADCVLLKRWRTSGMAYTAKESQIPAHVDSRKKGDIMVQCQLGSFQDLILDFSLTHPRYSASKLHPAGQWKLHGLDCVTRSKDNKHAISYEQGHHAYLSLTADTYGKISEGFVHFIWMVATSAEGVCVCVYTYICVCVPIFIHMYIYI